MKAVITFLVLIAFAASTCAAERPDKKLAIEYLKASLFEQIIEASIEAYSRQLFNDVPKEDRAFFEKMMRDTMGWEATKDDLANLVIGLYTKDELKAFLAFAKTRHGASFNAKSVRFSDEFSALLANNIQRFLQQCPLPVPNASVKPNATQE